MGEDRDVGRAPVTRHVGRARLGRARGVAATPDRAGTEVVPLGVEPAPPVFVDSSGRRRRRLRRLTYLVGFALLVALVLLWLSQLGGPIRPEPVQPCPPGASAGGGQGADPAGRCDRR
jgi:hypothetical protein